MAGGWEAAVLLWIQEYVRNPIFTPFFQAVTSLGNAGIIWILLGAAFAFMTKTRKAGAGMLAAMLLSFLVNNMFLKIYIGRIRPYEVIEGLNILIAKPADYSFPSGHTACAAAAAAAFWMGGRLMEEKGRWFYICRAAMAALAVCIGFSRLYLGVHYPTDVAAGAISGWIMAWLGVRLVEKFPSAPGKKGENREEKDREKKDGLNRNG